MKIIFIPIVLLFSTVAFLTSGCRSIKDTGKTSYDLDVNISPAEGKIESRLRLGYLNPHERTDSVVFFLHRNLAIESFSGEDVKTYSFDTTSVPPFPFTPEAGRLIVKLKTPIDKNETADFRVGYSGRIGTVTPWKINRIREDWVELGLYSPWFPYDPNQKELSYKINLKLEGNYEAAANGSVQRKGGAFEITNPSADNDIVIAASKYLRKRNLTGDGFSINLSSAVEIADSTAENILSMGEGIFQNYKKWFGDNNALETSILIAPRETGGGYARKGFIVLSKISDSDFSNSRTDYLRYFAHEIAHLWFYSAPGESWEDWLNESFAEFAALMTLREMAGGEEFLKRINRKKEKINSLPPIRGIDRKSEQAYGVLYNKGCCRLYELEQEIGKEDFLKLMSWIYVNHISSTESVIEEIEKRFGKNAASDFSAKLDR